MNVEIDAETGARIEPLGSTGVVGFCSWRRLGEVFRNAEEIRQTEKLVSYRITSDGIFYSVKS